MDKAPISAWKWKTFRIMEKQKKSEDGEGEDSTKRAYTARILP